MYRAETAAEIDRFLDPEYWGGKMIGEKCLLGAQLHERVSPVQAAIEGVDVAIESLERVANQDALLTTKQIFMTDEVFLPDQQTAGSVVIYRKEVLEKDPEKAEKLVNKRDKTHLPLGLTFSNLPPEPNEEPGIQRIVDPPYIYYSGGRIGIVAEVSGANGPNELIYISKVAKIATKEGRGQGLPIANIEHAPFVVGRTRRYITKKGTELLIRVNALAVFGLNQNPKPRKIRHKKPAKRDIFPEFFLPNQPSAQF
ncbi:hypothetical protein HZB74_03900 [Candidatus Saccharibacteria bacterium]|nr:hypothetical protein [Candidatus Saccharibacteria bacterium]